jgi:uncharacterized protein YunC (DUF1805 family)
VAKNLAAEITEHTENQPGRTLMRGICSLGLLAASMLVAGGGCGREEPLGTPADVVERRAAETSGGNSVPPSEAPADDVWRGLERHEIQLDQKLLVVKGSRGVIGCGYLNIAAFEKYGEACAIVPAVDLNAMPDAKVTAVTTKAKALGIEVGMSGREALERIR